MSYKRAIGRVVVFALVGAKRRSRDAPVSLSGAVSAVAGSGVSRSGVSVPAHALSLIEVEYPNEIRELNEQ